MFVYCFDMHLNGSNERLNDDVTMNMEATDCDEKRGRKTHPKAEGEDRRKRPRRQKTILSIIVRGFCSLGRLWWHAWKPFCELEKLTDYSSSAFTPPLPIAGAFARNIKKWHLLSSTCEFLLPPLVKYSYYQRHPEEAEHPGLDSTCGQQKSSKDARAP